MNLKQIIHEELTEILSELSFDTVIAAKQGLDKLNKTSRADKLMKNLFSKFYDKTIFGKKILRIDPKIHDAGYRTVNIKLDDDSGIFYFGKRNRIYIVHGKTNTSSKEYPMNSSDADLILDIVKIVDPETTITKSSNFMLNDNANSEFIGKEFSGKKIKSINSKMTSAGNTATIIALDNGDTITYINRGENKEFLIYHNSEKNTNDKMINATVSRKDANLIWKIIRTINPQSSVTINKYFTTEGY